MESVRDLWPVILSRVSPHELLTNSLQAVCTDWRSKLKGEDHHFSKLYNEAQLKERTWLVRQSLNGREVSLFDTSSATWYYHHDDDDQPSGFISTALRKTGHGLHEEVKLEFAVGGFLGLRINDNSIAVGNPLTGSWSEANLLKLPDCGGTSDCQVGATVAGGVLSLVSFVYVAPLDGTPDYREGRELRVFVYELARSKRWDFKGMVPGWNDPLTAIDSVNGMAYIVDRLGNTGFHIHWYDTVRGEWGKIEDLKLSTESPCWSAKLLICRGKLVLECKGLVYIVTVLGLNRKPKPPGLFTEPVWRMPRPWLLGEYAVHADANREILWFVMEGGCSIGSYNIEEDEWELVKTVRHWTSTQKDRQSWRSVSTNFLL